MKDSSDKDCNTAMNTAIRLISRRNHTEQEIRQKLRQRGFEAEVIARVISECERFNYINDKETARKYLGELRSKGQGIRGIRFSMKKKGIRDEIIDTVLDENHSAAEELGSADKAFQKKFISLSREKDIRKKREKIFRFLSLRGFSSSVISEVMESEFSKRQNR